MNTSHPPRSSASADWLRALERTASVTLDSTRTLAVIVDEIAASGPDYPALIGRDETLCYRDLAALMRRTARWAQAQGMKPGDRVALMMINAPVYAALWLGLSRVGIVTALINTQLQGDGLSHCLRAASPSHLIVGDGCLSAIAGAELDAGIHLWSWGVDALKARRLDEAVAAFNDGELADLDQPRITLCDPALLIYTSGTTGLPKAAHVSHYRVALWSEWFAAITNSQPDDRLYNCLPMYHSVGGVAAVGAMLVSGGAVIVRDGFSARQFWPDIVASGATIFQYIGELCRYLLASPVNEAEHSHRLRLCCGNGLREEVWSSFVERFKIPRILEFYAATEGSFSLFNLEGVPGCLGRVPSFMAHRSPVALVQHDSEGGAPPRGPEGFCVRCAANERGEAIGRLGNSVGRFEGYTNTFDTEAKVLCDVFAPGDKWLRTGDLMTCDAQGYYRFVERLGDTFRWKGENVSAAEVEIALQRCSGVKDVVVYGVAVPGTDGRAGMAALVAEPPATLEKIWDAVATLPRYARPIFLRFCSDLSTTGTFRPQKGDFARAGFSGTQIQDPMFVLRDAGYIALNSKLKDKISAGEIDWLRGFDR